MSPNILLNLKILQCKIQVSYRPPCTPTQKLLKIYFSFSAFALTRTHTSFVLLPRMKTMNVKPVEEPPPLTDKEMIKDMKAAQALQPRGPCLYRLIPI